MALAVARSLSLLIRQKPSSSTTTLYSLSACLHRFCTTTTTTPTLSQQHHNDNSSRLPTSGLPISETSLMGNIDPDLFFSKENGLDFEHWLVVTDSPPEDARRDQIIDSYIKTLAQVVGSEEEARMKICSVSTRCYFAFGALVSEELSNKLKELPNVRWVLPDSYLDADKKDYGGEPFIQGQAVQYEPKYHKEWIKNRTLENRRLYLARKNSSALKRGPLKQSGNGDRQSKPAHQVHGENDLLERLVPPENQNNMQNQVSAGQHRVVNRRWWRTRVNMCL